MTPLALEMLIWFHTRASSAGPFPNIHLDPQADIVQWFTEFGIIEPYEGASEAYTYQTTKRGDAWLKLCLNTPMPVQLWVDPRTQVAA